MQIKLTEAQKIKVLNSDDLYDIMQKILKREEKIDKNREHFWIVGLENNHRILFIELISLGTVNATNQINAMEVFGLAIHKRAVNLILVHNHPSGDPTPSPEDAALTRAAVQAGRLLDLDVLDHLVIGRAKFVSMKERKLGFS